MDLKKKQAFNQRMGKGKFPRHQNLAKGGRVMAQKVLSQAEAAMDPSPRFLTGGQAGQAGMQALEGAGAGAAIGTAVLPGIGTAVGAVGGALIGGISSLISSSSSSPQMPNITDPVTGQQITDANGNVVGSEQAVENYNQTLLAQNGAQNQSNVYNQEGQIAAGNGPNPALAQLNQTTGTNVANQAALMAGQRGASSNVGLMARQAAQQGAATQQQAVGQAATTESQQQLNALNAQAGIAGQQVAETQTGLNNAATNNLTNQSQILGAQTAYNSAETSGQGSVNTANTATNVGAQTEANTLINGGLSGASTALTNAAAPKTTGAAPATPAPAAPSGGGGPTLGVNTTLPTPSFEYQGGAIHGRDRMAKGGHPSFVAQYLHGQVTPKMASGGKVPAIVSPKEVYLNPKQVKEVVERGADPMKIGHHFPGKDKVKHDSLKNDVIKTELDEGGVVLPIHVTTHKNASHLGRKFVEKTVAKHMKRPVGVS
jgi:hypothetical protein